MGIDDVPRQQIAAAMDALHEERERMGEHERTLQELQDSLRRAELRGQTIVDALAEGVVVVDAEGQIVEANASASRILGLSPQELIGRSSLDPRWKAIHEDGSEFPGVSYPSAETLATGRGKSGVILGLYRPDGSLMWLSINTRPLREGAEERPYAVVASFFDISSMKQTEARLRAREEEFRALVERTPDPIYRVDREGRHLYVNPAVTAATGMSAEQMLGKTHEELGMPAEVVAGWHEQAAVVFGTGQETLWEFSYPTVQGERRFQSRLVPELGPNGKVATVLGVTRDITELKRTEERLATSEMWLNEAQHVARVGSWIYEFDTGRVSRSEAMFDLFGAPRDQADARPDDLLPYVHADDRERLRRAIQDAVASGEPMQMALRSGHAGGSVRSLVLRARLVKDERGRPRALVGTVQDVTEIKAAEAEIARRTAELHQAREMDRLKSNLVDTVSHELRTPLTSIAGYAEFLEDEVAGPLTPDQREYVTQIQAGAQRLQQLIDDLLDFARLEAGSFQMALQTGPLAPVLERAMERLRPQAAAASVSVTLEPSDEAVCVVMDLKRTEQILLNLIGNAIKFTPAGGSVRVRVSDREGLACVEVKDTGIGIAPEHLERLFDKFYQVHFGSTREHGGAGLGLSIVKALVETQGGTVGVESAPGAGSTFWFTLPRGADAACG